MNLEHDSQRKPRVFAVDDHDCMLRAVERVLGAEFSIVGTARSGVLAVPAILALQPDIVIMDIMMPDVDGLEACRRLRQSGSKVKILFSSVADDPATRDKAIKAGGDGFLSKLKLVSDLARTIHSILEGRPQT